MDKKYIKSEIQNLLETITEQTEVISAYELNIPQIELDIVRVNIRDLYEAYIQLDKLNRLTAKPLIKEPEIFEPVINTPEKKTYTGPPVIEAVTKEPNKIIKVEIKPEPEIKKEIAPKVYEEIVVKQETVIEQKPPVYTPPKEEVPVKPVEKSTKKSVDLFSDTPTLSDKYKNDTQTLNDKLAKSKQEPTIASKINKVPISDLKTAIGINDKFRFVNELFDGNLSDYSDIIVKLNAFDRLENALIFLDSLTLKHKWDTTSETFVTLKDLIERRYIK